MSKEKQRLESAEASSGSSIEVEAYDRLNLKELKELAKQHTIIFTPHVGNKWREDLYLMEQAGVHTANFERNASVLDGIDQPEYLRVDGQSYQIAHPEAHTKPILTPHLQFGSDIHDRPGQIIESLAALRPAHLHQKSTRIALPKAKLETFSESMITGDENSLSRDIIDQLHRTLHQQNGHAPLQIFSRFVNKDGVVYYLDQKSGEQFQDKSGEELPHVDRHEIGDLSNLANDFFSFCQNINSVVNTGEVAGKLSGPMPRNELMVLFLGLKPLLDDLQSGKFKPDQAEEYVSYAVSGPSMIKYSTSKDFKRTMDFLYQQIKSIVEGKFQIKMPGRLRIRMIPGAHLSYLPVEGETQAIDAISKLARANVEYLTTQEQLSANPALKSKEMFSQVNAQKRAQADAVANVVEAVKNAPNVSQYDLLEGKSLLDLEVIDKISFKLHAIITDQIRKKS